MQDNKKQTIFVLKYNSHISLLRKLFFQQNGCHGNVPQVSVTIFIPKVSQLNFVITYQRPKPTNYHKKSHQQKNKLHS